MTPRVLLCAIILCTLLLAAAMRAYPGGTQWDPAAVGNDFWRNYLCDLARSVALNGEPNELGSALARGAMTLVAVSFLPFFRAVSALFPRRRRLGAVVRFLGFLAVAAALPVALVPADAGHVVHSVSTVCAGVTGICAALLSVYGLLREEAAPRLAGLSGAVALAASTAAFVLYVRQFFEPGPGPVAGAVFERLAFLCVLAWLAIVAWRTGRAKAV